jgi:ribosomal protein L15E
VKAIIAREAKIPAEEVGGRPWPATSTLNSRWINDTDKNELVERMMK